MAAPSVCSARVHSATQGRTHGTLGVVDIFLVAMVVPVRGLQHAGWHQARVAAPQSSMPMGLVCDRTSVLCAVCCSKKIC
jgi:hypothetical protein